MSNIFIEIKNIGVIGAQMSYQNGFITLRNGKLLNEHKTHRIRKEKQQNQQK